MNPPRLSRLASNTLRGRLALLALVTTAVWVGALTVAFNVVVAGRLRQQADDLLRTRATAVAATVQARPDGRITVREANDDQTLDAGVWIYQGRTAIERPSAPADMQRRADALAGHATAFVNLSRPSAGRLYVLSVPAESDGRRVGTVITSIDLDPYHATADSVLAGSIALAVALLGGVYLLTRAIVDRALRPVALMSSQAAQWSEHATTTRRFGTQRRPAELAGLARNLDELLDRLAAVLRHERNLSAELSHELRTPLARVTAEAEWLTARPRTPAEQRAAHGAITTAAAEMRRICETLLSDARAITDDGSGPMPGRCEVREVAHGLVDRTVADRPQAALITVRGSPTTAGVSAAVTERILAPVLDNACRYARHAISVECTSRQDRVEISVSDDGPGVPTGLGALVFEAGRRGDPSDGHPGAGLGLPLARRLSRAAGGDLVLADAPSPLGGARFVLSLPPG